MIIYLLVIVALSIIHEFVHGYVAYLLGDDTAKLKGRLSFNPLVHVDPFLSIILPMLIVITNMTTGLYMPIFGGAKPVPFNPNRVRGKEWGVAAVAIAGPLSNLLMAFICAALLVFTSGLNMLAEIFSIGMMVNLGFFAFNIIPIPPLDGSRVLFAVAPEGIRQFMMKIEKYGLFLVFFLMMLPGDIFGNFIVTIINFFLGLWSGLWIF